MIFTQIEEYNDVDFELPTIDSIIENTKNVQWAKDNIKSAEIIIHEIKDDLVPLFARQIPIDNDNINAKLDNADAFLKIDRSFADKFLPRILISFISRAVYPLEFSVKRIMLNRYQHLYKAYHAKNINYILKKHNIPEDDKRWMEDPMPDNRIFFGVYPEYVFKKAEHQ